MPPPFHDPLFLGFVIAVVLASVATWAYLGNRRQRYGSFLAYEQRQPVPWGAVGSLLACVFVALAMTSAPTGDEASEPAGVRDPVETSQLLAQSIIGMVVMVGGFVCVVAAWSRANQRDLGLPKCVGELGRDIWIGVVACLAALIPVYGVLTLLVEVIGEPSHHPLVEMIVRDANPVVLLLATVSAVLVAPICEEIAFRLMLQGWLEKWHQELVARRSAALSVPQADITNDETRTTNDEAQMPNEEARYPTNSSFVIQHSSFSPHGWLPIVVSSTMFALAHSGQGSAPIALFFLAIILGYAYQRTHRIVPCIVAHASFNLLTMIALWWSFIFP